MDEKEDWKIVCCPYFKFFNYGEQYEAAIDWTSAEVFDKLDGNIMSMYFYAGQWHVASSKLPDASGKIQGEVISDICRIEVGRTKHSQKSGGQFGTN